MTIAVETELGRSGPARLPQFRGARHERQTPPRGRGRGPVVGASPAASGGATCRSRHDGRLDKCRARRQGERKVLDWHDPMVPGAKFDKPGKSPFMDMQLVPVYADEEGGATGGVKVDSRLVQNLGVRTAVAEKGTLSARSRPWVPSPSTSAPWRCATAPAPPSARRRRRCPRAWTLRRGVPSPRPPCARPGSAPGAGRPSRRRWGAPFASAYTGTSCMSMKGDLPGLSKLAARDHRVVPVEHLACGLGGGRGTCRGGRRAVPPRHVGPTRGRRRRRRRRAGPRPRPRGGVVAFMACSTAMRKASWAQDWPSSGLDGDGVPCGPRGPMRRASMTHGELRRGRPW